MNSLSWFLYLADVIPNLFVPFVVVSSIFLAVLILLFIVGFCIMGENLKYGETDGDYIVGKRIRNLSAYCLKWIVPIWLIFVTLQSLIPSKETIYLIAGSEIGEVVVNSPEAKEILNDVRTVIKQQIEKATE